MTELIDLLYGFEAEHIFAQSLYEDDDTRIFLEAHGYQKNMLGNLKAVYSNKATVDHIQNLPDDHPLRVFLSDSRTGLSANWHLGGPEEFGLVVFRKTRMLFWLAQSSAHNYLHVPVERIWMLSALAL